MNDGFEKLSTVKKFWTHYQGEYIGEVISPGLIRITHPYIKDAKSILDAGAANGALINLLRAKYPAKEIIGFDLVPNDEFGVEEGNIFDIHYPDDHFDLTYCIDVLEHLKHPDMLIALQELIRVLKNQGILVITVPNKEDLQKSIVFCPFCNKSFHHRGHLQSLNINDLTSAIEGAELLFYKETNLRILAHPSRLYRLYYRIKRKIKYSPYVKLNLVAIFRKN